MRRRRAPTATPSALSLLLTLVLVGCGEGEAKRANVLLVTLDTTRADFLGSAGAPGNPTPHLDALADEGVRFAAAVSASAVTPVSHASILTGLYPYHHGVRVLAGTGGYRLPEDVPTLTTVLHAHGYRTAAVHSAFPVSSIYGFARGFERFEDVTGTGLKEGPGGREDWDVRVGQRRSDATNLLVLDFLSTAEEPFFLWIHYWDPHDPALLPPVEFLQGKAPFGADGKPIHGRRELYGAEVSYVDEQLGRVVDALRERGAWDRTIAAVVADHGEGLDDGVARHGWHAHRILYQEQLHVPLLLRIPGAAAGVEVEPLVSTVDLFPTLLDYLDLSPPGALDGASLRPLIEGSGAAGRVAYADQINLWDANAGLIERLPKADLLHVAMDDRWKLIWHPSFPDDAELYDWRADPGETESRFEREPEVATRLMLELALRGGWVLAPLTGGEGAAGMSERDRALLAGLGYTDGLAAISVMNPPAGQVPLGAHWEWLCPVDRQRHPDAGPCPRCGGPCVPAARPRE